MDSEIFATLPPTKLFFRCAVPSMITMAVSALYQIADGLFVGRFIGGDALAAINLIMPIIMIVFGFANLIATGASVRISVLLGEKKREEASRVFTYTIKVIFLISCVLGMLGLVATEKLVTTDGHSVFLQGNSKPEKNILGRDNWVMTACKGPLLIDHL